MTLVFFFLSTIVRTIKMPKSLRIFTYSIVRKQVRYKYRFLTEIINKHTLFQTFFSKLKTYLFGQKLCTYNLYIPKPPRKTSQLREFFQPSKENIQHCLNFFLFSLVIFALPDPDPHFQCESGSQDNLPYHSNIYANSNIKQTSRKKKMIYRT
jgi:hypothetical protein